MQNVIELLYAICYDFIEKTTLNQKDSFAAILYYHTFFQSDNMYDLIFYQAVKVSFCFIRTHKTVRTTAKGN